MTQSPALPVDLKELGWTLVAYDRARPQFARGALPHDCANNGFVYAEEAREIDSATIARCQTASAAKRADSLRKAAAILASASLEELQTLLPMRDLERIDATGRRFIDVTPTWRGVVPLLTMSIENGDMNGRRSARSELKRMAYLADFAAATLALASA